jgi:exopolysaccharide production protein ExoZ
LVSAIRFRLRRAGRSDVGMAFPAQPTLAPDAPPRRRTKTLAGVQILRGLAALLVVVHHVMEESRAIPGGALHDGLIMFGASGVDVFFVISGFIMLYTVRDRFGAPGAAVDFLQRRLVRILPIYWLCTLAVLALWATGMFYASKPVSVPILLKSLLLLPMDDRLIQVGWTLVYEMYFYLIFAFGLIFLTRRTILPGFLVIATAGLALAQLLPVGALRQFLDNPIVYEFGFGMVLALLFLRGGRSLPMQWVAVPVGLILLLAASYVAPHEDTGGPIRAVRYLAWGLPAALVVWGALAVGQAKGPLGRLAMLIGDSSYSLYLTHSFVMVAFSKAVRTPYVGLLPPLAWMALATVASVIVGAAVYYVVERPLTVWLQRRLGARSAPALRPASAAETA